MERFEFSLPYVINTRFEDAEEEPEDTADNTYQTLVLNVPAVVFPYAPGANTTIEPGHIEWRIGYKLEELLINWAVPALDLSLTPKGNLKKADQEHLERYLRRLKARIADDLTQWLENDPRYQTLIRDRVNEAIRDLSCPRKVPTVGAAD